MGEAASKYLISDTNSDEGYGRTARPFVKWAGGKTQLLPELLTRVPERFTRYFEPFVGGGALFFALTPERAVLSDVNPDLINAYNVVKSNLTELMRDLRRHIYCEEYYYKVRNVDRTSAYKRWSSVRRAGRLIFLNKTCYNGLYRVNSKGEFNTPFGDYKNPKILDRDNLLACSRELQRATIVLESFEGVLKRAKKGDFVYFDPPYAPLSATSNFTSYSKGGFDSVMQVALRDVCLKLDKKGIKFMVSNSSAPLILELYKMFKISFVTASRAINSKVAGRGEIEEVIVTNY